MTEPVWKKFEVEFMASKSFEAELFSAFYALLAEFDDRLAPGNFDRAAVARCARHLAEAFEQQLG